MFHLEVRDKLSCKLAQNLTSATPRYVVTDPPLANWLLGLNLKVYTANREGTINTVEKLGVFTPKVAELQIESIEVANGRRSILGLLVVLRSHSFCYFCSLLFQFSQEITNPIKTWLTVIYMRILRRGAIIYKMLFIEHRYKNIKKIIAERKEMIFHIKLFILNHSFN